MNVTLSSRHLSSSPGALLAVLLLAAMVSGCAQPRTVPSAGGTAARSEGTQASEVTPGSGETAPPVQETAVPKPDLPEIDDDPRQLLDMSRDDLNGFLGRPALIRRENPAEVWQYRGKGCVLDVFLYAADGSKDSPYKVVYSEARDREARQTDQRTCLNELLRTQLTS